MPRKKKSEKKPPTPTLVCPLDFSSISLLKVQTSPFLLIVLFLLHYSWQVVHILSPCNTDSQCNADSLCGCISFAVVRGLVIAPTNRYQTLTQRNKNGGGFFDNKALVAGAGGAGLVCLICILVLVIGCHRSRHSASKQPSNKVSAGVMDRVCQRNNRIMTTEK